MNLLLKLNKKIILALILIIIAAPFASASANVAYVIKAGSLQDSVITSEISNMNFSYDIITDDQITFTNFLQYKTILIQGNIKNANLIPFDSVNSIFIVNYLSSSSDVVSVVWPGSDISKSTPSSVFFKFDMYGTPFSQDFDQSQSSYLAYSSSADIYYLRIKPSYVKNGAVYQGSGAAMATVGYSNQSTKDVFFGISATNYWTSNTKKLFDNSLVWSVGPLCNDNDGDYYVKENTDISVCGNICGPNHNESCIGNNDCNDNNNLTYHLLPGYIDNDKDGYGIGSLLSVCSGNNLALGYSTNNLDCNDADNTINPGSLNLFKNCRNDAPIILSPDFITVFETGKVVVNISAIDPENNPIIYSINDSRFVQNNVSKNVFIWNTQIGDAGNYEFLMSASDGNLTGNYFVYVEVNPKNKAPVCNNIPDLSWNENENSTIDLKNYCTDPEGNTINFSVYNQSSDISININNGVVNFVSPKNWFGNGYVMFKASDGQDETLTNNINLNVNFVNQAPVFSGNIGEVTWNDSVSISDALNLNDYFSDVDNNLTFSVSGNNFVNVTINNGIVSLVPKKNWFGTENVIFTASDGQFSINSNQISLNVLDNNKPPQFGIMNCSTDILENANYNCILNATDPENDSFSFNVVDENNLNCNISENVLNYTGSNNYYGPASCLLSVNDTRGGITTMNFIVQIEHVNQPPVINDYFPKLITKVLVNTVQRFFVIASDPDSPINISWYVNNNLSGSGNSYYLNQSIGNYNIAAIASDGGFNVTHSWNVQVATINDFTCSEANGFICGSNQFCTGNNLSVKDSNKCCSIACTDSPPAFTQITQCTTKNSSIQITIDRPQSGETYSLGDTKSAVIEVTNLDNEPINFNLETYLYDITRDVLNKKEKTHLNLKALESGTATIDMDIPSDLNENDNYTFFVKAYDRTNDSYCNQNYVNVDVLRKNYDYSVESMSVDPQTAMCGDTISVYASVKNTGSQDDNGFIQVQIPQLNILQQGDSSLLQSGDTGSQTFYIKIPDNAAKGTYTVRVTGVFSNGNTIKEDTLTLDDCKKENINQTSVETIHIGVGKIPAVSTENNFNFTLFFIVEGLILLLIIITLVVIIIFRRKRNGTQVKTEISSGEKKVSGERVKKALFVRKRISSEQSSEGHREKPLGKNKKKRKTR